MDDYICSELLENETIKMGLDGYNLSSELYPVDPWKTLYFFDYMKMIAYVIIIIGGLLGNISVILTVALNRSMRTTINLYVANLAVADAMICIFCMIPSSLGIMTEDIYLLGPFMCKFNPFTQMSCLTCSVLTLSAISCDRFIAIMFPLHVRITKQRTSVVMTIIWIVSFAVASPFLLFKKHMIIEWKDFSEPKCTEQWPLEWYYNEAIDQCVFREPLRELYYVIISITLFFLPAMIMITAYSLILWRLSKAQVPGEQHEANVNVHSRAKKKVNKMVFVVLVTFILCWTPMQGLVLYSAFGHDPGVDGELTEGFVQFTWFCYFIAYCNSFLNPIIYGGFNKTFREGFYMILRCGLRRNHYGRPGNARSRMTFTTGTTSPSRNTLKTLNGANKLSQKSTMEMKAVYPVTDGDISPSIRDTCVSIADNRSDM